MSTKTPNPSGLLPESFVRDLASGGWRRPSVDESVYKLADEWIDNIRFTQFAEECGASYADAAYSLADAIQRAIEDWISEQEDNKIIIKE